MLAGVFTSENVGINGEWRENSLVCTAMCRNRYRIHPTHHEAKTATDEPVGTNNTAIDLAKMGLIHHLRQLHFSSISAVYIIVIKIFFVYLTWYLSFEYCNLFIISIGVVIFYRVLMIIIFLLWEISNWFEERCFNTRWRD